MTPATIAEYYSTALEHARKKIASTPEERVSEMSRDAWIDALIHQYGLVEIATDATRETSMREVKQDPRRGSRATVCVEVPVHPSGTLAAICAYTLAPNRFSISEDYPPFIYDETRDVLIRVVPALKPDVRRALDRIETTLRAYNESIRAEDANFRQEIARMVDDAQRAVRQHQQNLEQIAGDVGIRLVTRADAAAVIPTALRPRATLAPAFALVNDARKRSVLAASSFEAILTLLDNCGRMFERTPQSFRLLTEEGLRDIILGGLNAVFQGAATGETFRGTGKVDIHLRLSQDDVFVAELKAWAGPHSLSTVICQLRDRLTWRDGYGVAIVLSLKAGFSAVLESVVRTLPTVEGFVEGTLQSRAQNHTVARFDIPTDGARQASLHVLVYNLYVADPGKRIVRRTKA